MASDGAKARLTQLWQWPLLLVSLALFGYASYLFINPQPGLTVAQRIDAAHRLIRFDRPQAGIEQLNNLLTSEKLAPTDESQVHAYLAEGLDQILQHQELSSYRRQLIEQTHLAMEEGFKPDAEVYRRLGESYEKLGKTDEALDNYRRAMALDHARALNQQRKLIDLQMASGDGGAAGASLDEYLKDKTLANSERAWALGEKAQILIDRGEYDDARPLIDQSLRLEPDDKITQGVGNYRLGLIAYKTRDIANAERLLRLARNEWKSDYPLDSQAAWMLGKIREQLADPREAEAFFQSVIVNDPEASAAPECLLGRGVARIDLGNDDAGLSDLHTVVADAGAGKKIDKAAAAAEMRKAAATLADRSNYEGALECLADEQALESNPAADFYNTLATYFEKRADQLEAAGDSPNPDSSTSAAAEKIQRQQKIDDLLVRAGDSNLACSRALTVPDDRGHAESMWKAVNLYDRAGSLRSAIAALELFVAERPQDGQAPEALLRLGRTYAAAGDFDKAIDTLDRIQFRYPQSLAAPKAAIPLAQAYIAKGPDSYPQAEKTLLSVVENNPIVTPEAQEFRDALFELGQLYYRGGRYEEAVGRLREMSQRYPNEPRNGQVLFLIADSYRKSAGLLAAAASPTTAPADSTSLASAAEAVTARRDRLAKARVAFDADIDEYTQNSPVTDLDRLYLKLSHFYRADCVYDLGNYQEAIKLYDAATLRYQDDPAALGAYVQIVNAYYALGKPAEARTANERAKWLLQHIPPEAFNNGTFAMPKEYWDQWLKWTGNVGMYANR
jgi:tetratricopeptide (TPR) repeat protein